MCGARASQYQSRFISINGPKAEILEKLLGLVEVRPIEDQIGQRRRFRRGLGMARRLCGGQFHGKGQSG
jgi:hypothetical protein